MIFIKDLLGAVGLTSEVVLQRCSKKNVFRKYAANLQENTQAEVSICCLFSEYLFLRTHLNGCFCKLYKAISMKYLTKFL